MSQLQNLDDYIWKAIHDNYLVFIVVTSSAQGLNPSDGFDFGAGKSTLSMGLLKYIYNGDEELVKKNMLYFDEDIINMLRRPERTMGVVLEDMQITFGKDRSHDKQVRQLANLLTGSREKVSVVIGNTPHIGKLAAAWKELWMFEIKIYTRGKYEIQQIMHYSPYKDPYRVKDKLHYKGQATFDKPSPELEAWYQDWRAMKYAEAVRRYSDRYMPIPEIEPDPISQTEAQEQASKAGRHLQSLRKDRQGP